MATDIYPCEAALGGGLRTTITTLAALRAEILTFLGQDFAVDLETSGLDYTKDRILGVALTFADGRSYYVVCEHTIPVTQRFGIDPEVTDYFPRIFCPRAEVMRLLAPLFAQPDITVMAHNAKFEWHFLTRAGIEFHCHLVDTMLAAQLLDENRKVGLKSLAPLVGMPLTDYKELEHYPGFKKDEILGVPLPLVADYAMDDTEATYRLWQRFHPQLFAEGQWSAFRDIWMPLLPVLAEMEERGIAMDMEAVRQAKAQYTVMAREAELVIWREGIEMVLERFREQEWADVWQAMPDYYLKTLVTLDEAYDDAGDLVLIRGKALPVWRKYNKDGSESKAFRPRIPWFNPGSTSQLRELLFDRYKLTVPEDIDFKLNVNGEVGVDKDTLKVLRYELGEDAPPVLDAILSYRKASKILSTYIRTYEEKCDEREHYALRTNFNQASTDTGRLSSSSPNLQNQPSRGDEGAVIRNLFVARPGFNLFVADYSMMELRMAANFSKDPVMCIAFREGRDLHSLTCAGQQNTTYDDVVARIAAGDHAMVTARKIAKNSNFGLLYGMGGRKFQRFLLVETGVKVSLDEAYALIDDFNRTYSTLAQWKREMERWVLTHEYMPTVRGRKRRFPDIADYIDWQKAGAVRQAINARVQGSCADIINEVIPNIQATFRDLGGSLLLQVHDELVGEVPAENAERAGRLLAKMMVERINPDLTVPLVAEVGIGDSWGAAK
jgi:DNA polymerase I-like protein with 3'-5' exonuclease and polymerase domains